MTTPMSLKLEDWPECDQHRWAQARRPGSFLSGPSPARKWSPRRCRICEQAYGQWLSHLKRTSALTLDKTPEARATSARIEAFVLELQSRVSSWSVAMMIGALQRMLDVMAPTSDWNWLKCLTSDLKAIAKPSRDKRPHMVSPEQLFDLGLRLMCEARGEASDTYPYSALKARDGLMIAMLICCPIRVANLAQIEIGTHLLFDQDRYWLRFSAEETKTGEDYEGELPPGLTPWIEVYLKVSRRQLLTRAKTPVPTARLWIDRWGGPMKESSVRAQVEERTRCAFGRHVWPHLFRTVAATGITDHAPDQIAIAPDLLGHASLATTRRHYILSQAMQSHRAAQEALLQGRSAATKRRRSNG